MALVDTTFAPYQPFGSRTLSLGATGTDVAIVQAVYNWMLETMSPVGGPIGAPIAVDGTYNPRTMEAVRNIQSYFGLLADGIVGQQTFFVFGQSVGNHTRYGGPVYGSRQLALQSSGGDVVVLQNRLNCFGYAAMLGGPATGFFNAATASAVLAFKHDAEANGDTGFPDNAIAGSGFYDASWLYTLMGGRAINSGRNGFDVVFLQVVLQNLGYYVENITGYYDALTRSAVLAFQSASKIAADGVVGPVTFYHLGLANPKRAPRPLAIAWPPSPGPDVTASTAPLVSQISSLHPYGEASLVVNQAEGFESLDVVANFLNPPATCGEFNAYAFLLTDPSTGQTLASAVMTLVSADDDPGDWAGTYSPGVFTIPNGTVSVYAFNTIDNTYGMLVLQGALSH